MTAGRNRGFDAKVAHPARVYDYWLGGKDNFEADRIAGEATIAAYPQIRSSARANRAFLARTVHFLAADQGLRQFLDIGTGLPTAHNTHEGAQAVAPESRIASSTRPGSTDTSSAPSVAIIACRPKLARTRARIAATGSACAPPLGSGTGLSSQGGVSTMEPCA